MNRDNIKKLKQFSKKLNKKTNIRRKNKESKKNIRKKKKKTIYFINIGKDFQVNVPKKCNDLYQARSFK